MREGEKERIKVPLEKHCADILLNSIVHLQVATKKEVTAIVLRAFKLLLRVRKEWES